MAAESTTFSIEHVPLTHPRLLASSEEMEGLKAKLTSNELGKRYLEFLRLTGQAMAKLPPLEREMQGRRLLHTSRQALKRILTWSLLYRIDGDTSLRDRAAQEMEAVCGFEDWNPSHYLDVGEMTLAVSIGTDWLWESLEPEQRERFLQAVKAKGIEPSLDEEASGNWWLYGSNNWNPVCHAGMVAGALLLAETEPQLAERVIARAIRALPIAMKETDPDGVYPEGPSYWAYGTHFTAVAIDLLETACGQAYGLAERESFQKSLEFRSHAIGPTGRFYNFYDNSERVGLEPVTAFFATRYDSKLARRTTRESLSGFLQEKPWSPDDSGSRNLAMLALWYPDFEDESSEAMLALPTAWQGRGPTPIAFARERWGDPDAFYLAFKGGDASVSHAHMDAGSFIVENDGVRWAIDLGRQNYHSIEKLGLDLWDRRQHSDRWRVFRLAEHGHNLLLIDQRPQDVTQYAPINRFEQSEFGLRATVELSDVHRGQAEAYQRDFTIHGWEVLQVTDRVRGAGRPTGEQSSYGRSTLRWRMLTQAAVSIQGYEAELQQEGKRFWLRIASPDILAFRAEPLDPPPHFWDEPNPGVTAIDIWCKTDDAGDRRLDVLMGGDRSALLEVEQAIRAGAMSE